MSDVRVTNTGTSRALHGLDVSAWDRMARWVCQRCNSGWLQRDVDEPARGTILELVQGVRHDLSEHEAAEVALWMARASLVNNADQQGRDNFVDVQVGRRMMTTLRPPEMSLFWIATTPQARLTVGSRYVVVSDSPKEGWVTTFIAAGELLLISLITTSRGVVEQLHPRLEFQLGMLGAQLLRTPAGPATWRRDDSVNLIGLDDLDRALTVSLDDQALANQLHELWHYPPN